MREKRVRFKDNTSAQCDAIGDRPRPAAASNEPKTSEFAFFKRFKQTVAQTSTRNSMNKESICLRKFGPSNHVSELDKLKLKDVEFSQHVKTPISDEIGSFLSHRNATLGSSAMTRKEHDHERFKCSSLVNTPTSSNLDSFISLTANAPVNPKNQLQDEDVFLSKRRKLLLRIAKTLFPEADEAPTECDFVILLLNRLLPESSHDLLSQYPRVRQPDTKEICQLNFDSNIQLEEDSDSSRMLVKVCEDHFLDGGVSASQSRRFRGTLRSGETVEGLDASAARNSYRLLLEHKEGNELHNSLTGVASGCWANKAGDRNLLTWGNDPYDYSTSASTSPRVLKNEPYMQFSYDAYGSSQSCQFRDQNHSYEALNKTYDSFAAPMSSGLVYKNETDEFTLDKVEQLSPDSCYDSCSRVSFERSSPSALNRDCTESDSTNDFETRREPHPLLLGWDSNVLDMLDSAHSSLMELEIYHPPSFRDDFPNSPELQMYYSPPKWSKDHWGGLENSNWLHMSPYIYPDHVFQGHSLQKYALVPRSPRVPSISCDLEKFYTDNSGLSIHTSKGSRFLFIPQMGSHFLENMMYERNCPALESFLISQDFESDSGLKCKSLSGILDQQYDRSSDNILELLGPGNSSSQFPIADDSNLDTSQPEHRCFPGVHIPVGQKDLFPLQLHRIGWKDTDVETYD